MFTVFEARSMADGTPAEGLTITAWYYDSSGSRVQINAPTHIGNGKYSIHCENAGTVVLETETANIFLPVLHFHNVSGTAEEVSSAVWSASERTLTSVDGLGIASSADMAGLVTHLQLIISLAGHWNLSEDTLHVYDSAGSEVGTWTVVRDSEGQIVQITPN